MEQNVNELIVKLPAKEIGFETAAVLAGLMLARTDARVYVPRPFPMLLPNSFVLCCDHLNEIPKKLLDSMLARSTIFASRVSPQDERVLEPIFGLNPGDYKLAQLPVGRAYLRLERTVRLDVIPNYYSFRPKSAQRIRARSRSFSTREGR
jgi:hypothetical protein